MIFDGHTDIWWDVTTRRLQGETNVLERCHLPRLRKGNIEGAIFVNWVDPPYTADPIARTAQIFQAARDELAECQNVAVVCSTAEIASARAAGKFYIVRGMEGLSGILPDPSEIDRVYEQENIRHISLTWNEQNLLATGVRGNPDRGLTPEGRAVVRRIEERGILLDVSHANEKTFWDVAELAAGPIVASHSNAKSLCDVPRNLTDDQIKTIAAHGGVIGLNAFNEFVHPEQDKQDVPHFIRHAAHIAEMVGVDTLAFGFDFVDFVSPSVQQSYSSQDTQGTIGLEDCSKVPGLVEEMKRAGFSDEDLQKITSGNWKRVMEQVWK